MKKLLLFIFISLWLAIFATAQTTASTKSVPGQVLGDSGPGALPKFQPAPFDSLIAFPDATFQRFNGISESLANFQNPAWVKQQVQQLQDAQNLILTTLMEANGKDPAKFEIKRYDAEKKKLVVKLKK
jgi:hypothetical protein